MHRITLVPVLKRWSSCGCFSQALSSTHVLTTGALASSTTVKLHEITMLFAHRMVLCRLHVLQIAVCGGTVLTGCALLRNWASQTRMKAFLYAPKKWCPGLLPALPQGSPQLHTHAHTN